MTRKILITFVLLLCLLTGCHSETTFTGGYAIVYLEGVPYLLNAKGETLDISQYDEIDNTFGSLILVKKYQNNKVQCGYIDNNGNEVIKPSYDMAYPFSDGLAVVVKNNKYQIINTENEVVYTLPKDYIVYDQFVEGYLRVEYQGKYTFLDKNFNIGTKFFDNLENFSCGLALASSTNELGITNYQFINTNYEVVLDSDKLKDYDFVDSFKDGFARVGRYIEETYYYSFINQKGEFLVDEENNSKGHYRICKVMEQALCDRLLKANNVDIYEHSIAVELLVDEENNSLFVKANNFHNGQAVVFTETPYRYAGASARYGFRYITTEGVYPPYLEDGGKYGFYKNYESKTASINDLWATFEPFVPGYIAVRDLSFSGNPLYKFYKITNDGVETLTLFTNDTTISKNELLNYPKPIELLSMKYNTFYDPANPQLLMVVKIYTNLYGIVNQNGEYITKVVYDNVII